MAANRTTSSQMHETVFRYEDYRRFLSDFVDECRASAKGFSHRAFAAKAGLTSPSLLLDVLKGKLGLTDKTIPRIIKGVGLRGRAATYFATLVRFNQSTDFQGREELFRRLQRIRAGSSLYRLDERHKAYVEHWYHPVVRELAAHAEWRGDYGVLGGLVSPAISARQAEESVSVLLELGLLVRNADGSYSQASAGVTIADIPAAAKAAMRNDVLLLGVEAARSKGPAERYVAHTTLSMGRESYAEATRIMDEARQRIIDLAIKDPAVEKVYELVMQVFPLSAPLSRPAQPVANQKPAGTGDTTPAAGEATQP